MIFRTGLKFALFAGFSLVLLGILAIELARIDLSDSYEVQATFDDVQGLFKGDDVKLAGVAVGQVKKIEPVDGRAEITFTLHDDVTVPIDSEAVIRWRNLIGQRYLYLYPGDSPEMLADGDRVESTRSVTDIGELFNRLGPLAKIISPTQLNDMVTALGQAMEGNQPAIDSLLDDLGSLLTTLGEREATIAALITDADTVATAIGSRDAQIRTMVDNLVLLTETFSANRQLLDTALVELGGFSTASRQVLTANEDNLDTILSELAVVTGTVADNVDELEGALSNLPEFTSDVFENGVARGEILYINVTCFGVGPPPCSAPLIPASAGPAVPATLEKTAFDSAELRQLMGLDSAGGAP